MACNLENILGQLNSIIDTSIKGSAASISQNQEGNFEVTWGDQFRVKNKAQAVNMAEQKVTSTNKLLDKEGFSPSLGPYLDIDKSLTDMVMINKIDPVRLKRAVEMRNEAEEREQDLEDYLTQEDIEFFQQQEADQVLLESQEADTKLVEIKKGTDFVFEQSPELAQIGTPQQYSQYLNSIFPDSKVKDIVYHGSPNAKLIKNPDQFKFRIDSDDVGITNGVYFSETLDLPRSFQEGTFIGTDTTHKGIISAIINTKNIKYYKDISDISVITDSDLEKLKRDNFDGVYTDMLADDDLKPIKQTYKTEIVVFDPEQIYILGSKQDIEKFKEWVEKTTVSKIKEKEIDEPSLLDEALTHADKLTGMNKDMFKIDPREFLKFAAEQYWNMRGLRKAGVFDFEGGTGLDAIPDEIMDIAKKMFPNPIQPDGLPAINLDCK